jgi:hypothetical protein
VVSSPESVVAGCELRLLEFGPIYYSRIFSRKRMACYLEAGQVEYQSKDGKKTPSKSAKCQNTLNINPSEILQMLYSVTNTRTG